jgi:hypothetical protein
LAETVGLQRGSLGVYLDLSGFSIGSKRQMPVLSVSIDEEMKVVFVKHPAWWGAVVFTLFLSLCHAAPGSAEAACNHLVSSKSIRSLDWNRLDGAILGEASLRTWANSVHPTQSPVRRPCTGMSCSSQIPIPSSTTSPTASGFDHWADCNAESLHEVTHLAELMANEPGFRSLNGGPSIFRPPPF